MNLTRYHQRFYSTPHYAANDATTPAVFAVRLMPLPTRLPHVRGHYAGNRRRSAGSSMLRPQHPSNLA